MKRYRLALPVLAFAFMLPALGVLAAAAPEVADSNEGFFALIAVLWNAITGGENALAAGAALATVITCIRNSNKIPILVQLKVNLLVAKIPKQWFTPIVAALSVVLAVVNALAKDLPFGEALKFGLEVAVVSSGAHELVKRPLKALGVVGGGKKK